MQALVELAPQIAIATAIVAAAIVLMRELKRLGNGKLDAMAQRLDRIDSRLVEIDRRQEREVAYREGEADASGRHDAYTPK